MTLERLPDDHDLADDGHAAARPVGSALRALRRKRRFRLTDVAASTGLSASFLSMVETGRSDITLGRLMKLVEFYGVSLADIVLDRPPMPGSDLVVRSDGRREIRLAGEGVDLHLLAPDRSRMMSPCMYTYEVGAVVRDFDAHEGEEWVLVLDGTLTIVFEHDTAGEDGSGTLVLERGDAAYYSGLWAHRHENRGAVPATAIIVHTPARL